MIAAALLFLKGIPPWAWKLLGLLVLIAAIFFAGVHWKGKRDQVDIDHLKTSLKLCGDTVNDLKGAVAKQNAAADAAKADGDARVKAGEDALKRNQAILAQLLADRAKSDAYKRPTGVTECDAAKSIVERDNAKK